MITRKGPVVTNVPTKFHEKRIIHDNFPAPWRPCFLTYRNYFLLIQDIIGTNRLTKFHEDRSITVISRVKNATPLSAIFYYSHILKNAPNPGSHVVQQTRTIFELIQYIIRTNGLTKCHKVWTILYVTFRLKYAPPSGGNVFQPTGTIFELVQDIISTNLLTKKTAPPLGGQFFQRTRTIFELVQDIIGTNLLITKNAPPPGGHVFQPTEIIFELIGQKNAASRVLTSYVFQATETIFELIQDVIGTNLLTTFYYSHIRKNTPPPGGHEKFPPPSSHVLKATETGTWTGNIAARSLNE
ncbi:hypothetical protein DPMN_004944 [Dreissena polymorpha]|uniref:Uncharacterized protein n=1 Tax=Dreissena polymorpha TaxID=45954 RepID=A0A9D4MSK5_DREPO|nr:hypothetical protein DPMN_004944 [Dreissena polymorpha]